MANYLKSEWYRVCRSKVVLVFTLIFAGVTLAGNILLSVIGSTDPEFFYNTVRFSLSNLLAMMVALFFIAGVLITRLHPNDLGNGIIKNAVMGGMPRWQLFTAKTLVGIGVGLVSMAVILLVYIGSAVLLLKGPSTEIILILLGGVAAALPSIIAVVILAIVCLHVFSNASWSFFLWLSIVFVVPTIFQVLGLYFEPLALVASWLPTNFFQNEVMITLSSHEVLWETSSGLAKCLIAGTGFSLLFFAAGLWQAKRIEL